MKPIIIIAVMALNLCFAAEEQKVEKKIEPKMGKERNAIISTSALFNLVGLHTIIGYKALGETWGMSANAAYWDFGGSDSSYNRRMTAGGIGFQKHFFGSYYQNSMYIDANVVYGKYEWQENSDFEILGNREGDATVFLPGLSIGYQWQGEVANFRLGVGYSIFAPLLDLKAGFAF